MGGRGSSSKIKSGSRNFLERDAQAYKENPLVAATWGEVYYNEVMDYIAEQKSTVESRINRTSFTDEGFGQWTLDIEGIGGISILDERDDAFFTGPQYGITVWDADYNADEPVLFGGSLNAAKRYAKELLKEKLK